MYELTNTFDVMATREAEVNKRNKLEMKQFFLVFKKIYKKL